MEKPNTKRPWRIMYARVKSSDNQTFVELWCGRPNPSGKWSMRSHSNDRVKLRWWHNQSRWVEDVQYRHALAILAPLNAFAIRAKQLADAGIEGAFIEIKR